MWISGSCTHFCCSVTLLLLDLQYYLKYLKNDIAYLQCVSGFHLYLYDKSIGSMSSNQDKGYEPDLDQKDKIAYSTQPQPTDPAGCCLVMSRSPHMAVRRSKGAFDETSWYPFTLFFLCHLLKGPFHHFLVFQRERWEFRNLCVPVTHPSKRGCTCARVHTRTHTDDSCITRDWHWLITASFIRVT